MREKPRTVRFMAGDDWLRGLDTPDKFARALPLMREYVQVSERDAEHVVFRILTLKGDAFVGRGCSHIKPEPFVDGLSRALRSMDSSEAQAREFSRSSEGEDDEGLSVYAVRALISSLILVGDIAKQDGKNVVPIQFPSELLPQQP